MSQGEDRALPLQHVLQAPAKALGVKLKEHMGLAATASAPSCRATASWLNAA